MTVIPDDEQLLTPNEAAERLHIAVGTLRWWRHQGTGPKSFKLGPKQVRYRKSDVEAWLQAQYDEAS